MKARTIQEVKQAKKDLEEGIVNLLKCFEKENDVQIKDVDVKINTMFVPHSIKARIKIEI